MEWYTGVLKKYAEFNGRAGRQEFWMFFAIHVGIFVVLAIIDAALGLNSVLPGLYWLATIVPVVAVGIRRLHDIGKPGIWILLGLIPCVGLILLYFFAQESVAGPNEYGDAPSGAPAA
jgi:uncharacterized membrane protein YhaH (DUF805 family)